MSLFITGPVAAPRLRARWISAALLAACASAMAAPSPTAVADLLRALGTTGVDVLYSSDLVPPNLMGPATLQGADPMSRAVEALAAHHLLLKNVGQRRYVVTRAPPTAQSDPDVPSAPIAIDEVSVFASRYAFINTAVGEPVLLSHSDLEQVPGAQEDVMRAIRAVPGLATNLSARPYIRGAFLNDVLVQYDGIPLIDPYHFKNFQSLISVFDPVAVDRVDVYTGGFPVKYGTRSAAVIDLAPRSVESGYENRVSASLLSYSLSTVGRADRWPLEWLATVRHSARNIVLKPVNGDIGQPSYVDALGRLRWQSSPASAWTLGWLVLDDRVQLGTAQSTEQANVHDRDLSAWIASDWALTGALHSRTTLSTTDGKRSRSGTLGSDGVANGRLDVRRNFSNVDLRTDWTYMQSSLMSWNFGAEAGRQSADLSFDRQELFADSIAQSFARPADATLTVRQMPRSSTLDFYASGRRHWQEFEAEVGARLDRQDYRGFGARAQVSPRVNLRFDPTSDWHVYGSWGQFTQAQRIEDWRSEDNQSTPDPATRAVQLIAGVAHESSAAMHWRVEVYRNHWSSVSPYFDNALNGLSLVPELGPDRLRIAPTDAETAGVELSARRSFGHGFEVSGAYALSRTTDDLYGRSVLRSWDQTHAANIDLAWQHAHTSASILVGWHSGWPRTPVSFAQATPSAPVYLTVGARNSARWGNYFTADVRLAQTVRLAYGELSLWVDATNVTDRLNECCSAIGPRDQSPPLTSTSWLARIVNVGFTWRFGT
jgi:hypothetical protein